jgi:hypothetical protein
MYNEVMSRLMPCDDDGVEVRSKSAFADDGRRWDSKMRRMYGNKSTVPTVY